MQVCRINCDVAPWSIRRKGWILFRLRLRPALLMANDYALHSLVSYHQMTQRKHGTGLFIYSVNYFDLLSELSNGHFKSAWRLMQMTNECAAKQTYSICSDCVKLPRQYGPHVSSTLLEESRQLSDLILAGWTRWRGRRVCRTLSRLKFRQKLQEQFVDRPPSF